MPPRPLLAPEYLHSLPVPNTPLTPYTLQGPLYAAYTPSGSQVPTLPASPQCILTPPHPQEPHCPLMPPIPLLAPEYLHSLLVPNTPLTPLTQYLPVLPNGPDTPTLLGAPNAPLCHLYPFWALSTYTPCQPHNTPSTPPDTPTPLVFYQSLCN